MNQILCNKTISLTFFDFEVFPAPIELDAAIKVTSFKKGELRKNKRTRQKHNSISYEKVYDECLNLDEAILDYLENFVELKFPHDKIIALNARQSFIRLKIPTQSSKNIQDGLITVDIMKKMIQLGLDLDLIFV